MSTSTSASGKSTGAVETTEGTTGPVDFCVEPFAELVGWWDGDGSFDDRVNGNHGQPFGNPTTTGGVDGEALSFDGVSSTLSMLSPAELDVGAESFSVVFWVRFESLSAPPNTQSTEVLDAGLVSKMQGSNSEGWRIYKQGDENRLYFCLGAGDNEDGCEVGDFTLARSSTQMVENQWFHVAAVKNGELLYLYIDGILEDQAAPDSYSASTDAPLQLGAWGGVPGNAFFSGQLDEVSIFSAPLNVRGISILREHGICKD